MARPPLPRPVAALALVGVVAALAAGCGDDARSGAGDGGSSITVFAAASLTDAFRDLADAFEAAHPGAELALSFAASSALREQVLAGAPADVIATADRADLEQLVDAGATTSAVAFASNEVQLVVPAGNPGGVTTLADLAEPDVLVGLCAAEVPCGRYGRAALARAGVTPSVDTEEPDVRSLLTKVAAGELDAGLVYRTDVLAAGDAVEGIGLPAAHRVVATCAIAVVVDDDGGEPAGPARSFARFVTSRAGQGILARHGFGPP